MALCMKVVQSHTTLCNPTDFTGHGILEARILEWVAFPFSRAPSHPRDQTQVSCIAGRFFTNGAIREALSVYVEERAYRKSPYLPPQFCCEPKTKE